MTEIGKIDEIEKQVAEIYRLIIYGSPANLPLSSKVSVWSVRAKSYLAAAGVVEKEQPVCVFPRVQLLGQAIELSLKAYILATTGKEPKYGHDLIGCLKKCAEHGIKLEDRDISAIAHINHVYFKDFYTETKFKARYLENYESTQMTLPRFKEFETIVNKICEQANQKAGDNRND